MTVLLCLLVVAVGVAWQPRTPPRSVAAPRPLQRAARWAVRRGRHGRRRTPELATVVTEVASRLRSGMIPEAAWSATVDRLLGPSPSGDPADRTAADRDVGAGRGTSGDGAADGRLVGSPGAPAVGADGVPPALTRLVAHCARDPGTRSAAQTVAAACRLTYALGAPLAEVLERCAVTVTEAERARDARRVALAGPRSTARILAGLPLLGLVLGAGLGADPLAVAVDGGWGTASVAAGAALLVLGRRWTRVLVAAAEEPAGGRRRRFGPRSEAARR